MRLNRRVVRHLRVIAQDHYRRKLRFRVPLLGLGGHLPVHRIAGRRGSLRIAGRRLGRHRSRFGRGRRRVGIHRRLGTGAQELGNRIRCRSGVSCRRPGGYGSFHGRHLRIGESLHFVRDTLGRHLQARGSHLLHSRSVPLSLGSRLLGHRKLGRRGRLRPIGRILGQNRGNGCRGRRRIGIHRLLRISTRELGDLHRGRAGFIGRHPKRRRQLPWPPSAHR